MFTLLSEESVSIFPEKKALYVSFIFHVCVCISMAWFSLAAVPSVRLRLTTVYAGSSEPVRVPQPIYAPVRTGPISAASSAAARKAVSPMKAVSPVQNDDTERPDYTPTAIPSDVLAMLNTDLGDEPAPGAAMDNIRRLSLLTPLGERSLPAPPEPPPGNPDTRSPITIGGHVEPATLVEQTKPVYPAVARSARIEGIVVLEGTINVRGKIENLHAVSGHPMLLEAAIEAVEKWKYRPAKLNGQLIPQPVQVQVRFTLKYPRD
jgi:periplasmic protein TonB